eukprot:s6688_g8.t1
MTNPSSTNGECGDVDDAIAVEVPDGAEDAVDSIKQSELSLPVVDGRLARTATCRRDLVEVDECLLRNRNGFPKELNTRCKQGEEKRTRSVKTVSLVICLQALHQTSLFECRLACRYTVKERAPISSGPKYDRHELLRTYGTCKSNGGALPILQESNAMEAPKELKYVLEDRPEDADAGGRNREARDKVKAMKRQTSDAMSVDEQPPDVQTPKVELSKELGTDSTPAAPDPMILAYLQSMMSAFAYPGMQYAGGFTTVMLRNIPNRYTRDMLIARLDKGYKNLYDFVYLPIDFSSKCNVGYAFINFRTPGAAHRFHTEFHGTKTKQCLPGFSSSKVAEVSFARVQGRDQNMENLRDEKFMEKLHDRPDWQPLFLDESGKEIPFSKAFPGDKKRSKKPATPATPTYIPPTTPTGYMRPPPSFPTFQPSFSLPPAPATTFASLLPSASADTLLMLKGVPVTYTRDQFVDTLKSKYGAAFDFIFLPNDAKSEGLES